MKQFSIKLQLIIIITGLVIAFTACKGGGGDENGPSADISQIQGKTWSIQSVNGSTTDAQTFILREFTVNADGTVVSAKLYPDGTAEGTWTTSNATGGVLTLSSVGITFSATTISGNTLSGSIDIPAEFSGKTTGFTGEVVYTSN